VITVVDASVVIKWLLQNPAHEADTDNATFVRHAPKAAS
jgi:predicted nucleic acid-binding protein